MNRLLASSVALASAVVLAACTSSGGTAPGDKASPKLAARYNAQLATAYMNEGRMDLARAKLADALKQAPHSAVVHDTLALYYARLHQYDKADAQYHLALRYKPDDPNTLNNYGVFLCSHGKARESLQYFDRAAANLNYRTPDSALANAGLCAQKIPDDKAAAEYFGRALQINADQPQALWQLGLMAFKQGRYSSANGYLSRLLSTSSKPSARILWVGVETAWTLGQRKTAERYGRELLKRYPASPEAKKFIHLLNGGS